MQLDWAGVFSGNGRPITDYSAVVYTGAKPPCSAVDGTGTSKQFPDLRPGTEYKFVVFAENSQGCGASAEVTARTPPGPVTALTTSLVEIDGRWDFVATGGTVGGAPLTNQYVLYYALSTGRRRAGPDRPRPAHDRASARALRQRHLGERARLPRLRLGAAVPADRLWPVPPRRTGGCARVEPDVHPGRRHPRGRFLRLDRLADRRVRVGAVPLQRQRSGDGASFETADTSQPGHCEVSGLGTSYLTIRVVANGGVSYDYTYSGN